ncbi:hypothetical protein, variant [Exophiala oligosperma]|uniref:Transcription factor domain-containing protein n=1 Tax=Exophiala oligosperma TaxID=215243 RepID=A0A0D2BGM0_9EURO|nr:uncharacterized protein PV06_11131 [Exophiala oligosperma]XP_016256834.1 hypothetical protein, variant [Exophiala oligosperma]KIW36617.1 hypothetical protein PV06_11131 [Exophiala oligosperma]KIW36618.1 hypothetical protein, variant [Exophiala oligosperma]
MSNCFREVWWSLASLDARLCLLIDRLPCLPPSSKLATPALHQPQSREGEFRKIQFDVSATLLEACHASPSVDGLDEYIRNLERDLAALLQIQKSVVRGSELSNDTEDLTFEVLLFSMILYLKVWDGEGTASKAVSLATVIMEKWHDLRRSPQDWPHRTAADLASKTLEKGQILIPTTTTPAESVNDNKVLDSNLKSCVHDFSPYTISNNDGYFPDEVSDIQPLQIHSEDEGHIGWYSKSDSEPGHHSTLDQAAHNPLYLDTASFDPPTIALNLGPKMVSERQCALPTSTFAYKRPVVPLPVTLQNDLNDGQFLDTSVCMQSNSMSQYRWIGDDTKCQGEAPPFLA